MHPRNATRPVSTAVNSDEHTLEKGRTTDMTITAPSSFWDRFAALVDKWEHAHPAMAAAAKAAGYSVAHTGGGCLALEHTDRGIWFLVCDDGNDLPTDPDQSCIAGGSDVDDGYNIAGINSVTPRDLFAVQRTFAELCSRIHRAFRNGEGALDYEYETIEHMLNEAVERHCVDPSEAEAVARLIATEDRRPPARRSYER
jgi:hypothetical protein